MWGFELTLGNGTKAVGCIFDDGTCYAHEPIADSYGSVGDMILDNNVMHFAVIGPVVAIEDMKRALSNEYEHTKVQLKETSDILERNYRAHMNELERLDNSEYVTPKAA